MGLVLVLNTYQHSKPTKYENFLPLFFKIFLDLTSNSAKINEKRMFFFVFLLCNIIYTFLGYKLKHEGLKETFIMRNIPYQLISN